MWEEGQTEGRDAHEIEGWNEAEGARGPQPNRGMIQSSQGDALAAERTSEGEDLQHLLEQKC